MIPPTLEPYDLYKHITALMIAITNITNTIYNNIFTSKLIERWLPPLNSLISNLSNRSTIGSYFLMRSALKRHDEPSIDDVKA